MNAGCLLAAAALSALAWPAQAQTYVSAEVGGIIDATLDGAYSQEDINYRIALGHDFGAWRMEGTAASQSSGISFENVDAYTFGLALWRDVDLGGDWAVYYGGGVDYINAHGATTWPAPPEYGDGWGWRVGGGVSYPLNDALTGFSAVTYQRAYLDFPGVVPFEEWEIYNLSVGVRWAP